MNTKIKNNSIAFMFLLLLFVGKNDLNAQSVSLDKNEFRLSVSDGLPLVLQHNLADGIITAFFPVDFRETTMSFGMLNLNYQRYLNDRFKVGGGLSYAKLKSKTKMSEDNYVYTIHCFSMMPQLEYVYLKKNNLELYGNASAGVVGTYYKEGRVTKSDYNFASQINPIGLRVGNKIAGFIEAGYGHKGFVNLGISFRF